MFTKTINLYSFDELDENARDKAREEMRDCNTDYDWHDFLLGDWKEKLEKLGYENAEIAYSGFCSQGDGASFTARVNVRKWLEAHKAKTRFRKLYNAVEVGDVSAKVIRIDHHYSHYNTVRADIEAEWSLCPLADELQEYMTEDVRNLSKQIYKELEQEYDYLTSEEAIDDTIRSNEWTFTESGKYCPR